MKKVKKTVADYSELVAQWDYTKNGDLRPEDVSYGSQKNVAWKCGKADDHEWKAVVKSRTILNAGCPYCCGQKSSSSNCLATTHPEIAKQWDYEKNGKLTPCGVTFGSHKNVWWICDKDCNHKWVATVNDRTNAGTGCPYCAGQKICLSNCLATTHPEIAKQWHPTKNGTLTPFNVTANNHKNVWWICDKECDHEWQSTIHNRTNGGNGCSCCYGRTVVASNCLATTHPEIAKQWHPTKNGTLTPFNVTAGSAKKAWWIDENGHEWQSTIANRKKRGCPICSESKGEKQVAIILKKLNIKFERQFKFDGCKDKRKLPFDFCVWKNNVPYLIEYQGQQHYEPVDFGSKKKNGAQLFDGVKKRDAIKRKACKDNSYPLLEISYWELKNAEKLIGEFYV